MNARHLCAHCNERPAVAKYKGAWAFRDGHDLCPQCWHALKDSQNAGRVTRINRRRRRVAV